jgi:hypothetical protein
MEHLATPSKRKWENKKTEQRHLENEKREDLGG